MCVLVATRELTIWNYVVFLRRWSIMSYFYWEFKILTLNLGRHVGLPAVYLHRIMFIGAETYRWVSRNLVSVIHNVKDLSDPLIMLQLITLNLPVIHLNFRIYEQTKIISCVKSKQKKSEKSKWDPKYFELFWCYFYALSAIQI